MTLLRVFLLALVSWMLWNSAVLAQEFAGDPLQSTRASKHSDHRALLIGIDDYAAIQDLCYCRRDMEAMRERLIKAGFPADQITLMHTAAHSAALRPLRANIQRELKRLIETAGEGDVLVVGFAGHGVFIDGTSYLCPMEARLEDPRNTMLTTQSVYEQLESAPARLRLLVVDACRNDPSPGGIRSIESPTRTIDGFARSLRAPPEGVLLLASCKPGQISTEDDAYRHGVFMYYLMRGLEGEADRQGEGNFDGRVSLLELYNYAAIHTKTHVARERNLVQTPVLYGTLTGDYDLAPALSRRTNRLPSRFYRMAARAGNPGHDLSMVFMRDPLVITATDPNIAASLREVAEYLFAPTHSGGVPRVVCERAIAAADEAARKEPDNPFVPLIRGEARRLLGDYEKALEDFNQVDYPLFVEVDSAEMPHRRVEPASRPDATNGADPSSIDVEKLLADARESYDLVEIQTSDGHTKEIREFDTARIVEVRAGMLRFDAVADRLHDDEFRKESGWLPDKYVRSKLFLKTNAPERVLKYRILESPKSYEARDYWYRKPGFADRHSKVLNLLLGGRSKADLYEYAERQTEDIEDRTKRYRLRRILSDPLRQRVPAEDVEHAADLCDDALNVDPGNDVFLALRGIARRKQRDFEGALADFETLDLPLVVNFKGNNAVPLRIGKDVTAEPSEYGDLYVTRVKDDWLWVDAVADGEDTQGFVRKADVE